MAERRMFAKTIVLSDRFLDMPLGSRALYMTLSMVADDDGFVNSPKSVMRQCGATEDDLKVLITKKFVIPFDSGVIVIKHWRINNYLRNDRYQETKYLEEKSQLIIDEKGAYKVGIPNMGIPSIDKVSIGKDSNNIDTTTKRFIKPSVKEIADYCNNNNYNIDAERFYDYYESKGWKVGKAPMKDWKAAVRMWSRNNKKIPDFTVKKERKMSKEDEELYQEIFGTET